VKSRIKPYVRAVGRVFVKDGGKREKYALKP
jgi:hypothetical protein